jgi:hypothetical protein
MDARDPEGTRRATTLDFLRLRTAERKAYIDEAAARRGLSPIVPEKDFRVCWLLRLLFVLSFRDTVVSGRHLPACRYTLLAPPFQLTPVEAAARLRASETC